MMSVAGSRRRLPRGAVMSETTPWWERGAPRASRDGDVDDACSFSTSETVRRTRTRAPHPRHPRSRVRSSLAHVRPLSDRAPSPPPAASVPQVTCKTEPDENGVPRRKCERIVTKFRRCPGR